MAKDPRNFLLGPRGGKPKKGHVPGLVYHVTPTERVEKVSKEGISARPKSERQWDTAFRSEDEHVYAWAHPARAVEHAKRQASRTGKDQTVLAIKAKTEGDHIQDWRVDTTARMDRLGSLARKESIPPEDIVDIHPIKK